MASKKGEPTPKDVGRDLFSILFDIETRKRIAQVLIDLSEGFVQIMGNNKGLVALLIAIVVAIVGFLITNQGTVNWP